MFVIKKALTYNSYKVTVHWSLTTYFPETHSTIYVNATSEKHAKYLAYRKVSNMLISGFDTFVFTKPTEIELVIK
jgi:hypothetical protein